MKLHVIAVYDRVTKQYGPLMTPLNIARVQQEFDALCQDPKTDYSKNPTDYEVHELGQFDNAPEHSDSVVKNLWFERPNVIATGKIAYANS